ncbi:hypothetical protein EHS25_008681 [Saitozyma podzolica]|uniref:DUF1996 domain-containing protein n=1 Tax=Saitozyma podzolica TaxID=1890683 RepID=A0A427YMG5_9TREE|nr:hypothetical protein EHS25_008681 [Saitozyma podzolica]
MLHLVPLVVALGANQAFAAYFVYGHLALLRQRFDPILSSGEVSSHVHSIVGASAFTSDMTFASAQTSSCTTAYVQDDKSGYWAPQLFYKFTNGTYVPIQTSGASTYWYVILAAGKNLSVVPDDFRMLAGNITRNTYNASNAADLAPSWECWGDDYGYQFSVIPPIDCLNLRPQASLLDLPPNSSSHPPTIHFPHCWNGVDAYLDNNAHVSYPIGDPENGPCPSDYPYVIPHLFMENYYAPSGFIGDEYEWYPGCFVLANGDDYGLSLHADWLNGWPSGMLVDAYEQCGEALQGDASVCSVLSASISSDAAGSCEAEGQVVAEAIGINDPLTLLPGNNNQYNSSSSAATGYPKVSQSGYVETAQIIDISDTTGGQCTASVCSPVTAGSGSGNGTTSSSNTTVASSSISAASASASSSSASPSSASASAPMTSVSSGSASSTLSASSASGSAMTSGGAVLAAVPPSGSASSPASAASASASDDGEYVCTKRMRRRMTFD